MALKRTSIWGGNPDIPVIELDTTDAIAAEPEEEEPGLFSELEGINETLRSNVIEMMKLERMTRVQHLAFPVLLAGSDVLIRSPTGSGKTLAYSIALMHQLQEAVPKIQRSSGCQAIIMLPTRELARQTYDVFAKLVKKVNRIVPVLLMGGQNRKSEKNSLRKGANIIVSTPGRLLDHFEATKCLTLDQVKWLVIDEADRLLDLGSQPKILQILAKLKVSLEHGDVL